MIKQKIKKQTAPTFKAGDRIKFYPSINERGMSMYSGTEYGIVTKMNKVTALVKTRDSEYKISIDELVQYVDPFNGWSE